jgi:hypothetical protein
MQYRVQWLIAAIALGAAGCTASERTCDRNTDCPRGQICRYDRCLERKSVPEAEPSSTDAGTIQKDIGTSAPDGGSSDAGVSDGGTSDDGGTPPDAEPTIRRLEAPQELQFDAPATEKTVELTNVGNTSVTLTDRAVTSNTFRVSSVRHRSADGDRLAELPVQLDPADTLVVGVRYESTEAGTDRGSLRVESNADNAPTEITLAGRTDGCLETSETIRFALVPVDSSDSGVVGVTNCSERAAFEFEPSLADDDDGAFSFQAPEKVTVPPGDSYYIDISFEPGGELREFEGELLLETNIPGRQRVTIELTASVIEGLLIPKSEPDGGLPTKGILPSYTRVRHERRG